MADEEEKEEEVVSEEVDETQIVDDENIKKHLKDGSYQIPSWIPLVILVAILVILIVILIILETNGGGE